MLTLPWDNPVLPGFIVFEGIDGAGTTTQAQRLVAHLSAAGLSAQFTCEPTDCATGTTIRRLLAGPEHVEPWTLALLYAADRHEHIERPAVGIRALLDRGNRIVSDRYLFSSLAYQGAFNDFGAVERLNHHFPLPEHLIFIDTPRVEASRRLASRATRDILERDDVQQRVEGMYREIIADFVRRSSIHIHTIDGHQNPDGVFRDILYHLQCTTETGE